MTGLAVTFPDPEKVVIDYLASAFAPRSELYKPATITTDFPAVVLAANATHLQVELEVGNADDYPVTERAQVRVTAYAAPGKRTNAKALASLTLALLASHPGSSNVLGVTIRTGRSDVVADADTGNLMVWLLARVALKPSVLAP